MAPTYPVRLRQFSPVIFSKHAPILSPTSTNPAPRSESYPIPWFNLKETQSKLSMAGFAVSTSKGMATTAGDVKVEPASSAWTEFNVTDVDLTVRIAARKGDVTISDGKGTVTLAQGQETTRDQSSDNSTDNSKRKNRKREAGGVSWRGWWSS
jgi:hypothetical protein